MCISPAGLFIKAETQRSHITCAWRAEIWVKWESRLIGEGIGNRHRVLLLASCKAY